MEPLRKHVEEMRDMYAAAIEAARGAGEEPSSLLLESWAKYVAAADSDDPGQAFAPVPSPHPTPHTVRGGSGADHLSGDPPLRSRG